MTCYNNKYIISAGQEKGGMLCRKPLFQHLNACVAGTNGFQRQNGGLPYAPNAKAPTGINQGLSLPEQDRGFTMGNEAKTENIVRELLRKNGYYNNPDIIVEEKKSDNPKIDKLLKNAEVLSIGV